MFTTPTTKNLPNILFQSTTCTLNPGQLYQAYSTYRCARYTLLRLLQRQHESCAGAKEIMLATLRIEGLVCGIGHTLPNNGGLGTHLHIYES